ncbi:hypothetical protein HBB16_08215 [Pseudonocardia sp. MCCB 268]|nr:hypothetical protein [Pseudonocardia cytotoxica]
MLGTGASAMQIVPCHRRQHPRTRRSSTLRAVGRPERQLPPRAQPRHAAAHGPGALVRSVVPARLWMYQDKLHPTCRSIRTGRIRNGGEQDERQAPGLPGEAPDERDRGHEDELF